MSLYSDCHAAPKAERRDVGDSWYLDCAMLVTEATAPLDLPICPLVVFSNLQTEIVSELEIIELDASHRKRTSR